MKKILSVLVGMTLLTFTLGAILGNNVSANDCSQSNGEGGFLSTILFKTVSADCDFIAYQGGKWPSGVGVSYVDGLDSYDASNQLDDSIADFNSEPNIELDVWNGTFTPNIAFYDEARSYASYTGIAVDSYIDGEFPDENYDRINIYLNENNSNGTDATAYGAFTLQGLISHELGHAMGLGHSTNSNRLMYCNDGRNTNTLEAQDKEYLQNIYD